MNSSNLLTISIENQEVIKEYTEICEKARSYVEESHNRFLTALSEGINEGHLSLSEIIKNKDKIEFLKESINCAEQYSQVGLSTRFLIKLICCLPFAEEIKDIFDSIKNSRAHSNWHLVATIGLGYGSIMTPRLYPTGMRQLGPVQCGPFTFESLSKVNENYLSSCLDPFIKKLNDEKRKAFILALHPELSNDSEGSISLFNSRLFDKNIMRMILEYLEFFTPSQFLQELPLNIELQPKEKKVDDYQVLRDFIETFKTSLNNLPTKNSIGIFKAKNSSLKTDCETELKNINFQHHFLDVARNLFIILINYRNALIKNDSKRYLAAFDSFMQGYRIRISNNFVKYDNPEQSPEFFLLLQNFRRNIKNINSFKKGLDPNVTLYFKV